jgi:hypothetical protein
VTGTVRQPCTVRTIRALAALLGVVSAVAAVVVQPTVGDAFNLAAVGRLYLAYIAVGVLILRAHPTHPVGRLMLYGGVIAGVGGGLLEVAWTRLHDHPQDGLAGLARRSAVRGVAWVGCSSYSCCRSSFPTVVAPARRGSPAGAGGSV